MDKPSPIQIRYSPEKVDYSLTEEELNSVCDLGKSSGKDYFLVTISISVSTLLNAIEEIDFSNFQLSLPIFLNSLIGCICLFLAVPSLISWRRTNRSKNKLVERIKSKDLFTLSPSDSDGSYTMTQALAKVDKTDETSTT